MKYRRLLPDELQELEMDFVRFLAANGVPAEDWVKMKETSPEKAGEMIDIFSDFIFGQTLKNLEYLEFRTPSDIKTFHCLSDRILLNGLKVEGSSAIDFTKNLNPEQMIKLIRLADASVKMYSAEKTYKGEREMELFKMMESGAKISRDGAIYKLLEGLKKK